MNRRTVLQSAGVLGIATLAGCIEGVQEHFGLRGVVPVEIHSEADGAHNVQLEAQEPETRRQTYDESYAVTSGEAVYPPNLERIDQRLRVVKFDEDVEESIVREVSITEETELVLVYIYDDDLVIDVRRSEDGDANETASNASADGDSNGDGNESGSDE